MPYDAYQLFGHLPIQGDRYVRDLWLVPLTTDEQIVIMDEEPPLPVGYENGHDPEFVELLSTIALQKRLRYDHYYGSAEYLRNLVENQKQIYRDNANWIDADVRVVEARIHPRFFLIESEYVQEHGYTHKQVKPTYNYQDLLDLGFAPEEIGMYPYGECQLELREGLVAVEKLPAYLRSLRWHHKALGHVMSIYADSAKTGDSRFWARDHWSSILIEFGDKAPRHVPKQLNYAVRIKRRFHDVEAIVAREAYEVGAVDASPPGGVLIPPGIEWPAGWSSRRPEGGV